MTCAVGPCNERRVEGSSYCPKHGPKGRSSTRSRKVVQATSAPGASQITCPHCGVTGRVSSRQEKVKRGVSGGKATGAVLTAGFSALATGLSRKQQVTKLSCANCGVTWTVE